MNLTFFLLPGIVVMSLCVYLSDLMTLIFECEIVRCINNVKRKTA